jgi:hypothetical protein
LYKILQGGVGIPHIRWVYLNIIYCSHKWPCHFDSIWAMGV